jgi:hypothetical protein
VASSAETWVCVSCISTSILKLSPTQKDAAIFLFVALTPRPVNSRV